MTNDTTESGVNLPDDATVKLPETLAVHAVLPNDALKISPEIVGQNQSRMGDSSYQNYLFGSSGSVDKPAWSDSMKGRAAIRVISRGLVGAAFMTWGGRFARNQLNNYSQHEWDPSKPLQAVAKGFDVTFGKLIKGVAYGMANTKGLSAEAATAARVKAAHEATTFRTKAYYHTNDARLTPDGQPMNGRSLGAEMVAVTFDFAMASIGDAMTRNTFQAIDPNTVKPWIVGEDGKAVKPGAKGHFDAGKFGKSVARASWRILSKNQGEDWVAALPYVYQMKYQRQFLSNAWGKRFTGTKLAFDNGWNGGSYEVNKAGQIIGDHQLPGAIDLHARFVGYNWYTLMFRESYDAIDGAFKKWKDDGFKLSMPHMHHPLHDVVKGAGSSARYVAKSFIKANLYMNPSVMFFWPMRVGQSKWRGGLVTNDVMPTTSAIGATENFKQQAGITQQKMAEQGMNLPFEGVVSRMIHGTPETGINFNYQTTRRVPTNGQGISLWGNKIQKTLYFGNEFTIRNPMVRLKNPFDKRVYEHYATDSKLDRFEKRFSQTLNPMGRASYDLGTLATKSIFGLNKNNPIRKFISKRDGYLDPHGPDWEAHGDAAGENFIRSFIDNSLSYTPYMYAKAEFGMRVDDRPGGGKLGQMDKAIYGLMDNVARFDLGATGKSIGSIVHLATHFEKDVKSREGDKIVTHNIAGDGSGTPVREYSATPSTKVNINSIQRDAEPDAPSDHDRGWAESVAGRNLGAQFQTPPQTRQ